MSRTYRALEAGFSAIDPKKLFFKDMRRAAPGKKIYFLKALFSGNNFYFRQSLFSDVIVPEIKKNLDQDEIFLSEKRKIARFAPISRT